MLKLMLDTLKINKMLILDILFPEAYFNSKEYAEIENNFKI